MSRISGYVELFRSRLARRWLRKRGVKLSSGIAVIPRRGVLRLEEGAEIHACEMTFRDLSVGAMTYIRSGGELANVRRIGRFCSIGNRVVLGQSRGGRGHLLTGVTTHPFQLQSTHQPSAPEECAEGLVVGHDVWIGREAMLFDGIHVGTGAVIAARAVVTSDVPPYAVVAGVPARIVRFRHPPEMIAGLLESRWWTLDAKRLLGLDLQDVRAFLDGCRACDSIEYKAFELRRKGVSELDSGIDVLVGAAAP